MEIKIAIKSVYGKELIYPACEKAKLFIELAGKKTFHHGDLDRIKALGFTIILVNAYQL